jgi:CDP-diacylglycerol--serine O-phosphatidyltransferase
MGKQLDSLSDVVSFGVAPSMILYQLLRYSYMKDSGVIDTSIWPLLPAFLVACAGAYRLARFNIDASQAYGFKGLPIPAAGILVASFPLIMLDQGNWMHMSEWLTNKWVLYTVIILLSLLMVSKLPLMALKFTDWSFKSNMPKYILAATAILAGILIGWLAIALTLVVYIVLSLAFKKQQA